MGIQEKYGFRYLPVWLAAMREISSGVPHPTRYPPALPGLWTKVNDIIGRFNDVEIMFHDNEGMARLDQSLKTFQQFLNVVHMQSR
jgi:hypothetical protein